MVNDRFAQLIARKLSGEASAEELRELESILKENVQSHYFFAVFSDYWGVQPGPVRDDIQEEVHFQQILAIAEKGKEESSVVNFNPVERSTSAQGLRKWLAAAVILGVIIALYLLVRPLDHQVKNNLALNEVIAKPGTKIHLLLPDGSKVWLNSDSRIQYRGIFSDSLREVTLEGEAFFDVVKDKTHPFIVHTSDLDVRVLGTAFNVKSYPKESSIEATLIRGLIEVINKKDPASPKIILHPYDKLVFDKEGAILKGGQQKQDAQNTLPKSFFVATLPKDITDTAMVETSWVYNKLLFDGETLRENAAKMERWYNVKIHFKDDRAGNTPIRYPLSNETIEEALKALQYIEPFNFKINDRDIEIWKK